MKQEKEQCINLCELKQVPLKIKKEEIKLEKIEKTEKIKKAEKAEDTENTENTEKVEKTSDKVEKKSLVEKVLFAIFGEFEEDKNIHEVDEVSSIVSNNISETTSIVVKPEIKPDHLLVAPPIVLFKNVTKKFGDKVAIKDVSFQIDDIPKSGEMISIVGPSGCGKSTILRILAGLTPQFPHTEGEVRVMGDLVTSYGCDRGLVDQKYSLLPHLTVAENISFGLKLRGISRKDRIEKAMSWIKKISLEGSENKFPHELSGGMQQRVSLAATLILEPKILLMDEPFGALDPKTRLKMQELLIGLWKELESTVLLVTHSMEEAVYLGDRIFRMEANPGRLVEILSVPRPDVTPEEMRKKPWFNDIVQELLHRIETGSNAKGKLKTKTYGNEDELELFKLMG